METIIFEDLGRMGYQEAWDYQESLLKENVRIKTDARERGDGIVDTEHRLLFVEHPPVYTIGKSGHMENVLLDDDAIEERGAMLFRTNRGGDVTFHGPGQLVGYP